MAIKYFFSGILVKLITGFDDTLVHIPIVANITQTKAGRIAFAFGIFLAVSLAIILSILFASALRLLPHYKYFSAGLVFLLAFAIYFDLFVHKPREKVEKKIKHTKISSKRILNLIGVGFIIAFATVIDDTIAYSSLFLKNSSVIPFAAAGIIYMTLIELLFIISFSSKISKLKWKKEMASIGLIVLGILILLEFL